MMKSINKTKKAPLIKYSIILMGIIFLIVLFSYSQQESADTSATNSIDSPLLSVQMPRIKGIDNVLLYENNDNNIISINITFKGGAALDSKGFEGLSNFLAESMPLAAGGYSVAEFSRMFDEYSIKINTNVSRDAITLEITTLNYYKNRAFNLLKLILNSPNLGNEEIALTKSNLTVDYNIRAKQPKFLVSQALRNQLFGGHEYFRDINGNPTVMSKITPKILKDFKHTVITKANMYVAISGNISRAEVEKEFGTIVEGLPEGNREFLALDYVQPKLSNKVIEIPLEGASQSEVLIAFNSPPFDSPTFPFARLINTYMGQMPDSLLFDNLRNQKGLVYTVSSSLQQDSISNYWLVSLGTSLDNTVDAVEAVKQTIEDLKSQKYDFKNIVIAKNWMLDNELRVFANNRSIAAYLNRQQFLGIPLSRNAEFAKLYNNMTADNINQALLDINTDNMVIIKVVSKK
ncbi:MAG: insulinase family protein [Alphaproteobacteria bacterium]|jgi:zinc protease|nr:insulinase family protein [Alphaproteobacteria bacterium]